MRLHVNCNQYFWYKSYGPQYVLERPAESSANYLKEYLSMAKKWSTSESQEYRTIVENIYAYYCDEFYTLSANWLRKYIETTAVMLSSGERCMLPVPELTYGACMSLLGVNRFDISLILERVVEQDVKSKSPLWSSWIGYAMSNPEKGMVIGMPGKSFYTCVNENGIKVEIGDLDFVKLQRQLCLVSHVP